MMCTFQLDAAPNALEYVSAKHWQQVLSLVATEVVENVPAPQFRQMEEFKKDPGPQTIEAAVEKKKMNVQ